MAETARARSAERYSYYILTAGIGLGIVLRFIALGAQSLWVDELLTIKNAHIGEPGILSYIMHNLQGPAISLMVHVVGAFTRSEALLRLPFAVAGALAIPAVYLMAREVTDRWTSLHTTVLLALSPIHIWYSQEVRGYAFVVLFSVLSTYYLLRWTRRERVSDMGLYAICLFAGLMSNLSMVFVGGVHLFYLLLRRRRARVLFWWAVAVCVVLAAFYPWAREILVRVEPERVVAGEAGAPLISGASFSPMAIPYSIFVFGLGYTLGPPPRDLQINSGAAIRGSLLSIMLGAVALAIPLLAGLVRVGRTDRDLLALIILYLAIPALAVSALAVRNIRPFNPRYMLVALPAYMMLLGAGTAAIARSRFKVLLIPLVAVIAVSLCNYFGNPRYAKDDLRSAAGLIEREYRSGDVVVAVFTAEPLEFYLEGVAPVNVFGLDDIRSPSAMEERCRSLSGEGDRVWLSLCREWQVDPDGIIRNWFEANLEKLERHSFTGVDLFLYGKRGT